MASGVWGPRDLGYVIHTMSMCSSGSTGGNVLLACGSFLVDAPNVVDIFSMNFDNLQEPTKQAQLPHAFPVSCARWLAKGPGFPELLITSSDYLRIWNSRGELQTILQHTDNHKDVSAQITSVDVCCDASTGSSAQLASCDSYGLCGFWDVERGVMHTKLDLEQPLCDVGFGPGSLAAVAGNQGDCFLVDRRQPREVGILAPPRHVRAPATAKLAWGLHRPDIFAVAWQGEHAGTAIYNAAYRESPPQLLRHHHRDGVVADLSWSPAFPELLCCAGEHGTVEVFEFSRSTAEAVCAGCVPCLSWEPKDGRENCASLALSREVRQGLHVLVLGTASLKGGSLWITSLPEPSCRRSSAVIRSTSSANDPLLPVEAAAEATVPVASPTQDADVPAASASLVEPVC